MPAMQILIEVVGWSGALLILIAYALLSTGRLEGRSRPYNGINSVGSLGFVINSGWNGAWPSAALNLVWMGIGVATLARLGRVQASQ
jgi:hypothetical protein